MEYNQEKKYFKFYKDKKEDSSDFSFDDDFKDDDFKFEEDKEDIEEDKSDITNKSKETAAEETIAEETIAEETTMPITNETPKEESESADEDFNENEYESYKEEQSQDEKKKDSPIGLIILVIVLFLLFLAGGYFTYSYFFSSDKESMETLVEDSMESEEPIVEEVEPEPEPDIEPEEYEIPIINERTGNAHIIVSSSVDGDLAKDYADSLVARGYKCSIISPFPSKLRYRVTVASYPTVEEAVDELEQYRSDINSKAWVLKY